MIGDHKELKIHVSQGGASTIRPIKGSINNDTRITVAKRIVDAKYSARSSYLKRTIRTVLYNRAGDSKTFINNKMSISGNKYIGIQQDMFVIHLYNINLVDLAKAISDGYIIVQFFLENDVIFAGTIKNVNIGRENIIEEHIEIYCLTKVTDLLADMVRPITINSSMNYAAILRQIERDSGLNFNIPPQLNNLYPDETDDIILQGTYKNMIEDIIQMINEKLSRIDIRDLPWIEYDFEPSGVVNLFSSYSIGNSDIVILDPATGLLDAPVIEDMGITFNSIFRRELIPGRVVQIRNEYISTIGVDTAFIYAFDPEGKYVITEVAISLANYPNKYTISAKARPLSKYNNFTASKGIG